MRTMVFMVVSAAMLFLSLLLGFITTPILIPALLVGFEGMLLIASLKKIPTKHIGIEEFLGTRQFVSKGKTSWIPEGWHIFVPFLSDYSDVSIENNEFEPVMQSVMTPDMAAVEIQVGATIAADPQYAINFENAGGMPEIEKTLRDLMDDAVRTLAIGPQPPSSWEDAVRMKSEFLIEILNTIFTKYPPEDGADIKEVAEKLKTAKAVVHIPSLGILVKRLNVTKIRPTSKLAEAAETLAIERRQKMAEHVEQENVRDLIIGNIEEVKERTGQTVSFEQASEIVQTERGKITKTVAKKTLAIDPETREFFKAAISPITDAVGAGFNKVVEAIASKTKSEETK